MHLGIPGLGFSEGLLGSGLVAYGCKPSLDGLVPDGFSGVGLASVAFLVSQVSFPEAAGVKSLVEVGDESFALGRVTGIGATCCSV